MTAHLRAALAHGRRIAWVRALATAAVTAALLVGAWQLAPRPLLMLAWSTPFLALTLVRLVLVAERPWRALPPVRDAALEAQVGDIARVFGVRDNLALRWAKAPTRPAPDSGLRTRMRDVARWAPNASHADGLAPGSVLVLHPTLRKMPGAEPLRFILAHELAHAAHDTALLRSVPGLAAALLSALFRGALLSLFAVGTAGLAALVALLAGRQLFAAVAAWCTRQVEYACDRTAVAHTGNPAAGASAVDWLSRAQAALYADLVLRQKPTLLDLDADQWNPQVPALPRGPLGRLFSTHPSPDKRVARIHAATSGWPNVVAG